MTKSAAGSRLAGWLAALERLRVVPAAHRDERVSRRQALLLLRCGEDVLDELCDRGLPHAGAPPGERYDSSDLTNLALMSRSNRSFPELGAAFVSRLARATPPDWTGLRRWIVRTRAFAEHEAGCAANPSWAFRRPVPERLGGACREWVVDDTLQLIETAALPAAGTPTTLGLKGRVDTLGEVRVVRSSILRELYREVLEKMEFFVLPASLEKDIEEMLHAGGADCVGISVLLEHECRRAGYQAIARRGFLLGLLGMGEHCWLEVLDDDGRMKILDPTLPIIARRSVTPTPAFSAFCLGSISNRLLPFDCRLDEQIVEHRCGGEVASSYSLSVVEPEGGSEGA